MFTKQITLFVGVALICSGAFGQKPSVYHVTDHIGKLRVHLETSVISYRSAESTNYLGFGFGTGAELYWYENGSSRLSFAPTLHYNQASEELKTYSVENNAYYYRSTTLTGRLLFAPAIHVKRNLGKQLQIGIGFQPQFVLHTFKDYYIYGTSVSAIPDVEFRKTEVSLLASINYMISPRYTVNLIGQFGASPVLQNSRNVFADGVRMQISRRIF